MNMKYEILNIEISRKHSITMKRSTDVLVYFTLKYTERTLTVHYGVWGIQYYGEILLILYSTLHLSFFPSLCLSISPSALSLPPFPFHAIPPPPSSLYLPLSLYLSIFSLCHAITPPPSSLSIPLSLSLHLLPLCVTTSLHLLPPCLFSPSLSLYMSHS